MPKEMRVVPVMVHLEPSLHTKLIEMLVAEPQSASSFMRTLLIAELRRRGMMTDTDIVQVTVGA